MNKAREYGRDYIKVYKEILGDLSFGLKRYLKYQVLTRGLILILILPAMRVILNALMQQSGYTYLANSVIAKFIFSPQGFLAMATIMVAGIAIILIELGGLITITNKVLLREEESSYFTIAKYSIKRIPYCLGIGGLLIVIYMLVLSPFLQIGIRTSIVSAIDIPGFIQDVIDSNAIYSALLVLFTLGVIYFVVKWSFSLQYVLLDRKKALESLKASSALVKGNWDDILRYAIAITVFNLLMIILIVMLNWGVALSVIGIAGFAPEVARGVVGVFTMVGIQLATFIFIPFEIILLTRLYYRLSGKKIVRLNLESVEEKPGILDKVFGDKRLLTLIIAGMFVVAIFNTATTLDVISKSKVEVEVTAHRGSSMVAPENTLSAVEAAIEHGADYAEIDVMETKDGEIILMHDKNLKRTTGLDKNVWDITMDEVEELDAGAWFSDDYIGEPVPRLEDVIKATKGRIKLNIELKPHGYDEALEESVIDLIEKHDMKDEVVITSIDYESLEKVREIDPTIRIGYIMYLLVGNPQDLDVDFYSIEASHITRKFVKNAHNIGREVHVWTINKTDDMENMIYLNVDNIITDYDDVLVNMIEGYNTQDIRVEGILVQ